MRVRYLPLIIASIAVWPALAGCSFNLSGNSPETPPAPNVTAGTVGQPDLAATTGTATTAVTAAPLAPPPEAVPPVDSAYSVYDSLKGNREWCELPTEPCDNGHRTQN
jgi:hypothetical protein